MSSTLTRTKTKVFRPQKSFASILFFFFFYNFPFVSLFLASKQCGPGSIPGPGFICGLSLVLVLVFAPRVFLRFLQFSSLQKNQHFRIRSEISEQTATLKRCHCKILIYLFVLFIYLFLLASTGTRGDWTRPAKASRGNLSFERLLAQLQRTLKVCGAR